MEKCETCRFYRYSREDRYAGEIGSCCYNPPVFTKTWNAFPEVTRSSWCGKWQNYILLEK